jgi:hypothetical protein
MNFFTLRGFLPVDLLLCGVQARFFPHHYLSTRHGQVDSDVVQVPLVVMAMWDLHDDPTAHDSVIVDLEFSHLAADIRFDSL